MAYEGPPGGGGGDVGIGVRACARGGAGRGAGWRRCGLRRARPVTVVDERTKGLPGQHPHPRRSLQRAPGAAASPVDFRRLNFPNGTARGGKERSGGVRAREREGLEGGRSANGGDVVSFECNLLSRIDPDASLSHQPRHPLAVAFFFFCRGHGKRWERGGRRRKVHPLLHRTCQPGDDSAGWLFAGAVTLPRCNRNCFISELMDADSATRDFLGGPLGGVFEPMIFPPAAVDDAELPERRMTIARRRLISHRNIR